MPFQTNLDELVKTFGTAGCHRQISSQLMGKLDKLLSHKEFSENYRFTAMSHVSSHTIRRVQVVRRMRWKALLETFQDAGSVYRMPSVMLQS